MRWKIQNNRSKRRRDDLTERQKNMQDFYSVLAKTQNLFTAKFDEFLQLDSLILLTFKSILSSCVEKLDNANPELAKFASCFDTLQTGKSTISRHGHHSVSLITTSLSASLLFGRSSRLSTVGGRRNMMGKMFAKAPDNQRYYARNHHFFIWWDVTSATGRFLLPNEPPLFSVAPTISEIANTQCTIIMCMQQTLLLPKTVKTVFQHSGFRFAETSVHVCEDISIGTSLKMNQAEEFCRFLMSQRTAKFRKLFLQRLNPILCENPCWNLAFNCTAQARERTIWQYMSHIRGYALFSNKTVLQTFDDMLNQKVDDQKLAAFFRWRLGHVKLDTVLQGVNAFVWFYRRFLRIDKVPFHEATFTEIKRLKKRLSEGKDGSAAVNWKTMRAILSEIKRFRWGKFLPQDVYDVALISLWGALRVSESCGLSKETTFLSQDAFLKVTVWDSKSGVGDEPQWKFISSFASRPDLCPIQAFERLCAKRTEGALLQTATGKCADSSSLNKLFKPFIAHLKDVGVLDKQEKYSWHVFRASYINISFEEFGIPIHFGQSTACHKNIQSTRGYAARTENKRRMVAAKKFAARAEENFRVHDNQDLFEQVWSAISQSQT